MKIHNYNNSTFEYEGEDMALESPLEEGVYLFPTFTTTIKPLKTKKGFAVCFDEISQKWKYVEDNRGKEAYSTNTKEKVEIDYLGAIKDEHTLLVPKKFDKWEKELQNWVEDEELKNAQLGLEKKAKKLEDLNNLTVLTSKGNIFDGNETARSNMSSAILSAEFVGQTEANWKMADNSVKLISLEELKEALALSIQKVGEIVAG